MDLIDDRLIVEDLISYSTQYEIIEMQNQAKELESVLEQMIPTAIKMGNGDEKRTELKKVRINIGSLAIANAYYSEMTSTKTPIGTLIMN